MTKAKFIKTKFMSEAHTISGGWLGTYAYGGAGRSQSAVRFEATIAAPAGDDQFTGSILDDGKLGEADIRGEQSGLSFRFTKTYRQPGSPQIFYEGTLAEDGQTMTGTWRISRTAFGVWDAHRAWSDTGLAASEETEEEAPEEWEEQRVREVVRLG